MVLGLRCRAYDIQFGYTVWVYSVGIQFGYTVWVYSVGIQYGYTVWVNSLRNLWLRIKFDNSQYAIYGFLGFWFLAF